MSGPPPREWARRQRWGTQPPPWWPDGREWQPRRGQGWQRRGGRMARRIGCAIGAVMLLLGALGTALVWLVLSALGVVGSAPFTRLVSGIGLLLGLGAIVIAAVLLRRVGSRAGRLVEAAQQIETGDYSVRAPVRGPSELRALARAFNAMTSRLEAEEARRRSVLADVAHELRTPLTVIRGQAEGIVDGVYPADQEHIGPILRATQTMERLIEDLRTLALAETGALRLNKEPLDIVELINETLDTFGGAAKEAGVTLDAATDPMLPPVNADPVRLRSVISNLVANALRYTPRGGTARVSADLVDASHVRVAVRDSGAGIAAELLPRVFDRFVKGPGSQGSGLGLAIVRDIVEAHGGSVAARSAPGDGTTVEFVLPA